MKFLEGETLAERLTRGALPVDQALTIAIEILRARSTLRIARASCTAT